MTCAERYRTAAMLSALECHRESFWLRRQKRCVASPMQPSMQIWRSVECCAQTQRGLKRMAEQQRSAPARTLRVEVQRMPSCEEQTTKPRHFQVWVRLPGRGNSECFCPEEIQTALMRGQCSCPHRLLKTAAKTNQ
eukprot:371842-Rhodomonas_salina.4